MITLFRWFSTNVLDARAELYLVCYWSMLLSKTSNWDSISISLFKLIWFNCKFSISLNSAVTSFYGVGLSLSEVCGRRYLSNLLIRQAFWGVVFPVFSACFNGVDFLPLYIMGGSCGKVGPSVKMLFVRTSSISSQSTVFVWFSRSWSMSCVPRRIICFGGKVGSKFSCGVSFGVFGLFYLR